MVKTEQDWRQKVMTRRTHSLRHDIALVIESDTKLDYHIRMSEESKDHDEIELHVDLANVYINRCGRIARRVYKEIKRYDLDVELPSKVMAYV